MHYHTNRSDVSLRCKNKGLVLLFNVKNRTLVSILKPPSYFRDASLHLTSIVYGFQINTQTWDHAYKLVSGTQAASMKTTRS